MKERCRSIYDQMQFEPEEQQHRALTPFRYTSDCLVYKYALMLADILSVEMLETSEALAVE